MKEITSTKTIVINGVAVCVDSYMRDGAVTLNVGGITIDVGMHCDRGERCTSVEVFNLDGDRVHSVVIE